MHPLLTWGVLLGEKSDSDLIGRLAQMSKPAFGVPSGQGFRPTRSSTPPPQEPA